MRLLSARSIHPPATTLAKRLLRPHHRASSHAASPARMSPPNHFDAIILGSGQAGTPLAKAFADAGRKTALIERAHIGGTCLNEGCTPTKTMIASGSAAYLARRAGDFGVHCSSSSSSTPSSSSSGSDDVRVDMVRVRQRKRDMVASFVAGSEARLRKAGVEILKGQARFVAPRTLAVKLNERGPERSITGDLVFIDAGERPARPALPGLETIEKERVLDSTSIMELGDVPLSLAIVGGAYIGLEFGQLFKRLGSKVTIVQRAERLVPREDADIAQAMLEIFHQDGAAVYLSSNIKSVSKVDDPRLPINMNIETSGAEGLLSIPASHILLAAGRTPNTAGLNLDAAGVKTDARGHIIVNERLATTAPGVYALGDVHGGPAFTHMSYDDFRIIRANLLPQTVPATTPELRTTSASRSRNLVPYTMYTAPQLGHVGLHEHDLVASGRKFKTAKMPMSYVARALETDESRGMMKAHVDAETGEILGFTCLGAEGGEIMAVVQTAMMGGLKWWDLEAAVWTHPSFAESLNNLWGFLE